MFLALLRLEAAFISMRAFARARVKPNMVALLVVILRYRLVRAFSKNMIGRKIDDLFPVRTIDPHGANRQIAQRSIGAVPHVVGSPTVLDRPSAPALLHMYIRLDDDFGAPLSPRDRHPKRPRTHEAL